MKYRILEKDGIFYPQEKKSIFHFWAYIDRLNLGTTWSSSFDIYRSWCASFEEAKHRINERKEYLIKESVKTIIHEL